MGTAVRARMSGRDFPDVVPTRGIRETFGADWHRHSVNPVSEWKHITLTIVVKIPETGQAE